MPQSLAKNLIHLVFSTSKRELVLTEAIRAPLCASPSWFCATRILAQAEEHVEVVVPGRLHTASDA